MPKYRVIATGTVVTKRKKIFDVYSQWKFLNPERFNHVPTFAEFRDHYGVWRTHAKLGFPVWIRNRNVLDLQRRIHLDAYSVTRAECFDLPPRLPAQLIHVDLDESREAYVRMAKDMIVEFMDEEEPAEATIPLVQILRLAQITSGFVGLADGKLKRIGTEKLDRAKGLLEDWFDADEKVVIGARWVNDIHAISAAIEKMNVPVHQLYGKIKLRDRAVHIAEFNSKPGPRAFVMQPQAGSLGIDLRSASIFLWLSLTHSWVDFTQSEDRIALNPHPRSYCYLIARDTIDQAIYDALQEDGKIIRFLQKHGPDALLGESLRRRS